MSGEIFSLGLEDEDKVASTLGGGIPTRSIILVEGKSGTGKSVWLQRIAKGVCGEGKKVTYVSEEETGFSFVTQMDSLSYDVTTEILQQELLFLHADANRDSSEGIIERLLNSDVPWRSDVAILDNFGRLVNYDMKNGSVDDGIDFVERFQESVRGFLSEGKSIVIAIDSSSFPENVIRRLRSIATVQIELENSLVNGQLSSRARVKQYKNMKDRVDDVIDYNIKSGRGISIESRNIA